MKYSKKRVLSNAFLLAGGVAALTGFGFFVSGFAKDCVNNSKADNILEDYGYYDFMEEYTKTRAEELNEAYLSGEISENEFVIEFNKLDEYDKVKFLKEQKARRVDVENYKALTEIQDDNVIGTTLLMSGLGVAAIGAGVDGIGEKKKKEVSYCR